MIKNVSSDYSLHLFIKANGLLSLKKTLVSSSEIPVNFFPGRANSAIFCRSYSMHLTISFAWKKVSTRSLPAMKVFILWVWFDLLTSLGNFNRPNLILALLSILPNLHMRVSKVAETS